MRFNPPDFPFTISQGKGHFDVHPPDVAQTLLKCGGHLIGFSRPDAYVLPFIQHLLTKNQGRVLIDEKTPFFH